MKNARCLIALAVLLIGAGMDRYPARFTPPVPVRAGRGHSPPGLPVTSLATAPAADNPGQRTKIFKKTAQVALLMGSFFVLYVLLQPNRTR